jgi:hypothetical protein
MAAHGLVVQDLAGQLTMNARRFAFALIALNCALASFASAQTATPIERGTRVRVTTTDVSAPIRIARFEAFTDSTLVVSGTTASRVIPLSTIQRLESSRRTPNLLVGAVGLLLGAAAGAAAGCAANRDSYGVFCGGQSDLKVFGGAAIGGVAGATLGALLFERDRWSPVELSTVQRR